MPEKTRRQFLEAAGTTVAVTVLAPTALASARATPRALPAIPVKSPLPIGPFTPAGGYQTEIYVSGMSAGIKPIFTTNSAGVEAAAANALSGAARRHLLAEAGGAAAVRNNARALQRWRIVPRMFIDRDERDLSTTVLGVKMPAPVILGPVAAQTLAHADGETASARAADGLGLTYVHAEQAGKSVEDVALAAPLGSRWFGLDWPGDAGPDAALLARAKAAGCTHLLVAPPQPGKSWEPLAAIRRAWGGAVVLGGIQDVAGAREAVRRGVDGIVVSNERGRRGSAPLGTIDMLPRIADAVGTKTAVLFGSGVVSGTDTYRALALGADAVVLGRPYVHGLALAGDAGVTHVLRTILAELEISLAIAGVGSLRELGPGALLAMSS